MVKDKTHISRKGFRRNSIIQFAAAVALLVLVNIIASFVFARFDLTQEKRFSLSKDTRSKLKSLNDVAFVKVYLEGDLPPQYKRLRNSVKELLDEFKVYAGDNLEYEFIDPSASGDVEERNKLYQELAQKGIQPTNIREKGKGETTQKIIFPGAILNYKGKEVTLQLLKSSIGMGADEMVNNSAEGLEYEFMNGLRKTTIALKKKVAFLQGHGELNTTKLTDAARSLADAYEVDTVMINGDISSLKKFKALVIAKPDSAFTERDKFIIDQFIMNGGKVLWLIDQMQIDMDSLAATNTNVAIAKQLNLDDQLFCYGARINYNLVMDLQAAPIPVVTGYVGNQPRQELFPWYFFPLINPQSAHPIVHNLNAIKMEFASSIDTIEVPGVQKTILLTTSKASRQQMTPVRVSLNMLQEEPNENEFRHGNLPVSVLLEGTFTSNYKNRIPATISQSKEMHYKASGVPNRMIIVSDGDVIGSFVSKKGKIFPLGYDRFTGENYGNRNFILNCVDYLLDDAGLMTLRTKEFKIRLIDKNKAEEPWVRWLNLLFPVAIVGLFGFTRFLLRKRKYAT
jgi:ABC-2 type transport system permease protein